MKSNLCFFSTTSFLAIFANQFLLTTAIQCYHCGSGAVEKVDECWETDPYKRPWIFTCPEGHVCLKQVHQEVDENGTIHYYNISRGCALQGSTSGHQHQVGCGTIQFSYVDFEKNHLIQCMCDTDYCNSSRYFSGNAFTIGLTVILSMLIL